MAANFTKAKNKAAEVLSQFNLVKPPIDPEAIAEAMGVDVVYARFGGQYASTVSGYLEFDPPRIVVNVEISPARKTFTIAHELGHFLMHKEYAASQNYQVMPRSNFYENGKPDEEREADAFAAALLAPISMLRRYRDMASPRELARMFLVSEDVILNQLKWL